MPPAHEEVVHIDFPDFARWNPAVVAAKRMFCACDRHGRATTAIHHRDQEDAGQRMPVLELEPRHR